jgi:predicted  nucleic acid-binding Zn-ribbon protein
MPGIGETFREIHRLRRFARELQQEIDRGPIQLKARRNVATKIAEAYQAAQDELKKLKVTVHEKEGALKATHTQIAKYEKQQDEVGDKKQYDALKHEIATAQAKAATLEDEILNGMSETEERTAKLPEQEKAATKGRDDLAAFEREQGERLTRLAEQLKDTLGQLKEAERGIPEQYAAQYQRMVTAFGADALAAVENHSCAHCHTQITIQQMHDVDTGELAICRACGRGLYQVK